MMILPMFALASAIAADAAPQQGTFKSFGDWAVACDNIKYCEFASLIDDGVDWDDGQWQMSMDRKSGPDGEWSIIVDGVEVDGPISVAVDGVGPKFALKDGALKGTQAAALVTAMANGKALQVMDQKGKFLGSVSLKGSSAALRYSDDQQGRVGTVTAIVAKGPKPASAVLPTPKTPVIEAVRPAGKPEQLSAALQKKLWSQFECGDNYEGREKPEIEVLAMGGGATLALVPCGAGAYNFSHVPYVVRAGKVTIAQFDLTPGWSEEGPPMLVNVDLDPKTGVLSSQAKGRGIGDCGGSESYAWDGHKFRLVNALTMEECKGAMNWLRVWTAEIKFK